MAFGPTYGNEAATGGRHQHSAVRRLVCDTGRVFSVFDLIPRATSIKRLPTLRLERISESPPHLDQALCVAFVDNPVQDYVVSGDMSGVLKLWQP
jgi:hypothetical protein